MARAPITKANPYYSKKYDTTFHTEREYRDFLARKKGFPNWNAQQRAPYQRRRGFRNAAEVEAHKNALKARTDILKRGMTKRDALKRWDLTRNAFRRHVGGTLEYEGRRWRATTKAPFRRARMLTSRGDHMVHPRNDVQAARVGQHWNAAKAFAEAYGSDREAQALAVLRSFDEDRIDGEAFMTDPDDVLDYYEMNPDSFESIYEEAV